MERMPWTRMVEPQTWMADAACRGLTSLFFPERHAGRIEVDAARAVCSGCDVLAECRRWAVSADSPRDGILAGCTPRERAQLRRQAAGPQARVTDDPLPARPSVTGLFLAALPPEQTWGRAELLELRAAEG